ncbi:DUF1646 family protein [Caldicellulosiruptor naganoensis]|uniref:DUF1646 domain-containing protein n=1 Tax=Caldicellulosiruptor naganoensis TaxID=29324 RepID=A0ABY7BJF5_9FIRM|nr:DUF1646 family protein [Caldicellulosiruptor naganoensis]WAM31068.1 DUF1646 domain-containing protein [Caldicellulosiruptor naganoensis]WAM32201.1 DUF1646 domain-containing protein [Caldicellulosiruptor naganoensis]
MISGLIVLLLIILFLPFFVKAVEHNLEYFLFIMGIIGVIISKQMSLDLFEHILKNHLLYYITFAVLIAGMLFFFFRNRINTMIELLTHRISIQLFVFVIIVILGLSSSFITAIIASLLLTEIMHHMPLDRNTKVKVIVLACFAIGFGAALTPVGEPLATITISKLKADFFYLARAIGLEIFITILLMAFLAALVVKKASKTDKDEFTESAESIKDVFLRAFKVFVFVFALELLGTAFKPLIDLYIIKLDAKILYWVNMISAIVDNATLAAAEISREMTDEQVRAIVLGMIISGGMLIPGNIPNIISAGKFKIKSKEWARIGVPIGLILMAVYFVLVFIIKL